LILLIKLALAKKFAAFMRRIGVYEERGSRIVLFSHRDFRKMSKEDTLQVCY